MARGATVTGFDISPKMVELAKARNNERGQFFVHDLARPFDRLDDNAFDIVLCALAMHYLEDWTDAVREFHRVLKPGGQLVLSVEHPFNDYTFFKSKRYFDVEAVSCTWKGFGKPVEVHSYRRPLGECLAPLTDNGFLIDKLTEYRPTEEFARLDPRHYRELSAFPAFMGIRAVKK